MSGAGGSRAAWTALGVGAAALLGPSLAARAWTASAVHPASSPLLRPADAALVLGARVWPDGRPSRFLRQRVEVGAQLFHRSLVTRVVLSGAAANREGLDEVDAMRRTALGLGVPPEVLVLDPDGVNTAASVRHAASLPDGAGSVIVCSQEFHLPRAVALARLAGLDAQGAYPPVLVRKHTGIGYVREVPATWKALVTHLNP